MRVINTDFEDLTEKEKNDRRKGKRKNSTSLAEKRLIENYRFAAFRVIKNMLRQISLLIMTFEGISIM